jgi:hypothetical protein
MSIRKSVNLRRMTAWSYMKNLVSHQNIDTIRY